MAFLDDLKNVFSTKTPEQIYAENVAREIKQLGDRTKVMVEMSSQLGMCERKFKNIIQDSRINAIRRPGGSGWRRQREEAHPRCGDWPSGGAGSPV